MTAKTNLYLFGVTGRMGAEISTLLQDHPKAKFVGGTSSKGAQGDMSEVDVLIDFSMPEAVETILNLAVTMNKPLVIGTTGLTMHHAQLIKNASAKIPVLQASNTSFGVAVLNKLVKVAAGLLDDSYDIEISETHHRQKLDAPSGTALTLGKSAAEGRGQHSLDDVRAGINRQGQRKVGQIGFAVQRGGGVFGEHKVCFLGDDEIIELSHTGLSRRLFARGAIKAALWLKDQSAGLYGMDDCFK